MKKVLVIGAAGFVGPYLIDELKNENFEILATKLKSQKLTYKTNVANLNILNKIELENLLLKFKPNYIINLAAQSSVHLSWKEPLLTFQINVMGCLNLFEAVRKINLKCRILIIGTSEQYGENLNKIRIKENYENKPKNFYALSKATQEKIGNYYVKYFGLDIVFTRSFNHIGPRQNLGFVVPDFCNQIALIEKEKAEPIIRVGNLNNKRDFSDVRDVVKAYKLLLLEGKSGEVYNVGSGKSISIKEILNKLLYLSKANIKVLTDKNKFRPIDTPEIVANITKLKLHTKFKPIYDIDESLKNCLDYYRSKIK